MKFEDLASEQREKAKACKTPEDVLALAKEEGYELSDEQLQGVSGGDWGSTDECLNYDENRNKNRENCSIDGLCPSAS